PGLDGVRLRGVAVEIPEVPGVRVWFAEVVVGWDRRPISVSGGKVLAVGRAAELAQQLEAWRARHRGEGGHGGGESSLSWGALEVDWRDAAEGTTEHVQASGVRIGREGGRWSVGATTVRAKLGGLR